MSNKAFTRGIGVIFLILGICGFIPGLVDPMTPLAQPRVMFHFGYLFNAFPMNYVLSGVMVLLGVAGLIASVHLTQSRAFERIIFVISAVFTFLGFLPGLSSLWGVMPLFGFTDGFFLVTCFLTFYFAFVEGPLRGVNTPVHPHWPK